MSYRRLAEALLLKRPYFGPALRAIPGPAERHRYMLPVVRAAAREGRGEILEVGSWAGASAVTWASAIRTLGLDGQVTCVDSWAPYFDLSKENGEHYRKMNLAAEQGAVEKLFRHNIETSGVGDLVSVRAGRSLDVLPALAAQSFDVIYLDGSHLFQDVLADIREAKRLIRPGGIICGDDLDLQLQELDPAEVGVAARSGLDFVRSTSNQDLSYHPGVTLAVAQEFGELRAWDGFWAIRFTGVEWTQVELDLTAADVPAHLASGMVQVLEVAPEHFLIACEGRYFAVSKRLGPPDIAAEMIPDGDLPPLILAGDSMEEVHSKLSACAAGA
jgi:predicted O-methyltransferase YrrM